jgi:hypothetical protein
MGLNASVYCDCYETGKVKTAPPQPELVYIDPESGGVDLRWDAPGADQNSFFTWLGSACEHGPLGQLVSHRLGHIARIAFLRGLFAQTPECFPTLLSKVVYNGVHGGDVLNLSEVEDLAREVPAVQALHCAKDWEDEILREFETQVLELVEAARKMRKPIVF